MAESVIMKTLNGRKVYDEDARKELEKIKNAAPGLVFETVADMEAYVAEHAGTLKVGQDLFIRAADVPDYWWDGTQAVPVETDLTEVRKELDQLSAAIDDKAESYSVPNAAVVEKNTLKMQRKTTAEDGTESTAVLFTVPMDTYSRQEIDAIMGSYVTDIANLIGGDANADS